jgi:hypothetical protein
MKKHHQGNNRNGCHAAISYWQISLKEGEKQHAPLDVKQKECTHKVEVKEDPNGRH